jgi:hypothetical protein
MNEDQAERFISILEKIEEKLTNIEINTMDLSSIETNTSEAVDYLRRISNNPR